MTRKLPKAVTRTAQDMLESGANSEPETSAHTSNGWSHEQAETSAPRQGLRLVPSSDPASAAITNREQVMRRAKANAIVERYANISAVGGIIPIPLLNVAGITAIIVRMVKQLCKLYGVPYEPGRTRALVVGVAGGAVPTTASTIATSTLVFFVPGVNLLGLAVSSVAASTCTRAIGRRFVEHFETGSNLLDFPVIDRR